MHGHRCYLSVVGAPKHDQKLETPNEGRSIASILLSVPLFIPGDCLCGFRDSRFDASLRTWQHSTTIETMDHEKKFLESHQARVNAIERSQRLQHADTLHVFWTLVREKLSAWENKLHALQETQGKKAAAYQHLQDLKEELQLLRKHCLGSTVCFDDWEVPDLPVADLRLLHNEFSKYFTIWEAAKEVICPKGKFSFRRYREEMARRKAQGIPLSAPLVAQTTITSKPQVLHKGACLQDISNESIVIDSDGNVRVRNEQIIKVSDAALLVRNLQNCSVVM
jgi:hypothetical protein